MRALVLIVVAVLLVVAAMGAAGGAYVVSTGLKAQPEPGAMETRVARTIRGFAIPREVKARSNPIGTSAGELKPGLEHFARYCAMCHGNDGSGPGRGDRSWVVPQAPRHARRCNPESDRRRDLLSSRTASASPACRHLAPASRIRPARSKYGSSCDSSATCHGLRLTRSIG
jgi:hypothetical protein